MKRDSRIIPSWLKHLDFLLVDLIALSCAFALSYWFKFDKLDFFSLPIWLNLFINLLVVDVVISLLFNPYSGILRRSYWSDITSHLKLVIISFLIVSVGFYIFKLGVLYSREMLIICYGLYLLFGLILKFILKKCVISIRKNLKSSDVKKVVLVTVKNDAREVSEIVSSEDVKSREIVGYCFIDDVTVEEYNSLPVVSLDSLLERSQKINIDEVILSVQLDAKSQNILEGLVENGIRVRYIVTKVFGSIAENQTLSHTGAFKTLDFEKYNFGTVQLFYLPVKRLIDIIFGLIGIIIMLPIAAIIKISYVASGDTHSIFYSHDRVGWKGRPFKLYKFRSMVWDADEKLQELLKDPKRKKEWEEDQKFSNDPRITGIGRFIRRTSIDEFPQFFNVFKGDMSLVGPRPLVKGELEEHGGKTLYNKVKPGITGWWGCNGRSNIEYAERLELEYHYVRHCSPYLDLLCVLRTIVSVIKRDGAH